MRGRERIARAGLVGGIALAALIGPAATPAKAECLYLDFWLIIEDTHGDGVDDPVYVHQGCVTETGYEQWLFVPMSYNGYGHPHGTPNGFYMDLRVPSPV